MFWGNAMMLIVNKITLEKPVFASYEIDGKPSEAGNKMDSTKVNVLYFFISFFFLLANLNRKVCIYLHRSETEKNPYKSWYANTKEYTSVTFTLNRQIGFLVLWCITVIHVWGLANCILFPFCVQKQVARYLNGVWHRAKRHSQIQFKLLVHFTILHSSYCTTWLSQNISSKLFSCMQ